MKFISDFEESQKIAKSKKPAIVIAANGMCEAGRIINHLKYGVENPNNTILIVGYMSENTLGRKILNKEEKLIIDKKELTLKAEVQKINAFSAHADYKEMLEWLQTIDLLPTSVARARKYGYAYRAPTAQVSVNRLCAIKPM